MGHGKYETESPVTSYKEGSARLESLDFRLDSTQLENKEQTLDAECDRKQIVGCRLDPKLPLSHRAG